MHDDHGFQLDARIAQGSAPVAMLRLCEVRLQLDARWPWLVLVPRWPRLREIEDLSAADRALLVEETVQAGRAVRAMAEAVGRPADKLNVGALGNVVAQLHVHVVGRRTGDPAWPGPVWGSGAAIPYGAQAQGAMIAAARGVLQP